MIIFVVLTVLCSGPVYALSQESYNGLWWNEDRSGIFEIIVAEENITGITRWGEKPEIDRHNPDPALQKRSLKDITFLWGFNYNSKNNSWQDGQVYDPEKGKTYSAKMHLHKTADILEMRGYIGISLFGRSAKFERVQERDMPAELKKSRSKEN
jgi:uncharacterized protein (DUF2147 family)